MTHPFAPSPSLANFGPYRRRSDPADATRALLPSLLPDASTTFGPRIDVAELAAALRRLTAVADPLAVFRELASVLVPSFCEEATATVYRGAVLSRWQQQPPKTADTHTSRVDRGGRGWTITLHTVGRPGPNGRGGIPDYVAAVSCSGHGEHPAPDDVALVRLAGQTAADLVEQARQRHLLESEQQKIAHLEVALETNRVIGAAVGIVMARRNLPYPRAFQLLSILSQTTNAKLVAFAQSVVHHGDLPVDCDRSSGTARTNDAGSAADQTVRSRIR